MEDRNWLDDENEPEDTDFYSPHHTQYFDWEDDDEEYEYESEYDDDEEY